MIWNQGPGVALGLSFFEDVGEPFQERFSVLVIEEDLSSFYSPSHYVLEKAGGVKSWLAGHGLSFWHGPACHARHERAGFEDDTDFLFLYLH